MELKITLVISFVLLIGSTIGMFWWRGSEAGLWFAVGGILSFVNLMMASWAVQFSLLNVKKSSVFAFLLMIKSSLFLAIIAGILVFLKPHLLGFTLGLSLIIVSGVLAALVESRRYFRRDSQLTEKQ